MIPEGSWRFFEGFCAFYAITANYCSIATLRFVKRLAKNLKSVLARRSQCRKLCQKKMPRPQSQVWKALLKVNLENRSSENYLFSKKNFSGLFYFFFGRCFADRENCFVNPKRTSDLSLGTTGIHHISKITESRLPHAYRSDNTSNDQFEYESLCAKRGVVLTVIMTFELQWDWAWWKYIRYSKLGRNLTGGCMVSTPTRGLPLIGHHIAGSYLRGCYRTLRLILYSTGSTTI